MSPAHRGKFVAYYRVSTDRQGKSGVGLEAQQAAVRQYLNGGSWQLVAEHVEIETGKRDDRPELVKALEACRKHRARLVIAKLDRLSRNLAFIATLMDSGVEFVVVDNPHANKLTVHILAAVAEHEREMISERTKAALQAARARGTRLGNAPREAAALGTASYGLLRPAERPTCSDHPGHSTDRDREPQRHCRRVEPARRPDGSGRQVGSRSDRKSAGTSSMGELVPGPVGSTDNWGKLSG
jgi:DNA invertase Pin-like site-specific DNA recombinase